MTRHWSFYLALVFVVFPIAGSVPASWLYVFYTPPAITWPLVEVIFSIYHVYLIYHVNKPRRHLVPSRDIHELQTVVLRVLRMGLAGGVDEDIIQLDKDDPRAVDFRNSITNCFGQCPWASIRLHDIHKWLYWAMFNEPFTSLDHVSHPRRTFLAETVQLLEMRLGVQIPKGPSDVIPMLLTLDPVFVIPRPFWWYILVAVINFLVHQYLGFFYQATYSRFNDIEYLIHIPDKWDSTSGPRPLVFIHGLGLGAFQYSTFLFQLLTTIQDRPVLILLQPHISQDIFHPQFLQPKARKETGTLLVELFLHLGWATGVDVFSHSNGSYLHAWLCKDYSHIINRSAFVDPTCFVLSEGDVCYNFLYRPCRNSIELIMRFFVGTELGVANLLQRHFEWSDNNLWFDEIPEATDPSKNLFVVGGRDDIVNAQRVRQYLHSNGITKGLWYDHEARHGEALVASGDTHRKILEWLLQHE